MTRTGKLWRIREVSKTIFLVLVFVTTTVLKLKQNVTGMAYSARAGFVVVINSISLGNTCHYWQFQTVSIELLTNGSYNHTFLCGWNCRPEAVLWTSNKTADQRQVYGHFSVYRAIFSTFFTKLLTMAVLWTLFGVLRYLTCGHVAKTADHGSSMDSFRPSSANCWPMAGLWTLFGPLKSCQQNCWP